MSSLQTMFRNLLTPLVPNNKLSMGDRFATPRIYDNDASRTFSNSSPPNSASPGFGKNSTYSHDNRRLEYKRPLNYSSTSPPPRKRRQLDRYSPQDVDYKDFFRVRSGGFVDRYTPALSTSVQYSESYPSKSQNRSDLSPESSAHRIRNDSITESEVSVNPSSKVSTAARNSYIGNCGREAESTPVLGIFPSEIGVEANGSTSDSIRESFDFSKVPKGPKGSSKGLFKKPSAPTFIESLVSDDTKAGPHIFISSHDVPILHTTVPHLFRRLRKYDVKDITMDSTGYYIMFERSQSGVEQASRCYRECNLQRLFSYTMAMSWSRGQPFQNDASELCSTENTGPIPPKSTEPGELSSTSSADLVREKIDKGQSANAVTQSNDHHKVEYGQSAAPLQPFNELPGKKACTGSSAVPSQHSPLDGTLKDNRQVVFSNSMSLQLILF